MQCVLVGFPNVGKSQLFNLLTGQNAKVSPHAFATYKPQLGTFKFEEAQIQIIDQPSFPNHSKSLVNSTDTILLIVDNIDQIKKAEEFTYRSKAKTILIFNKIDLLNENEKRKLKATLKSKHKKLDFTLFSSTKATKEELEQLKNKIFNTFPIIRIYTKEPKKQPTKEPMIMKPDSTLKDAAEKILKGMSQKIKRARVWGPSSKFGGQVIGLDHTLKDKDVVEFKVK